MSSVFDKKGEDIQKVKQEHEEEKETLIKKISELPMDVDYLKKARTGFTTAEKKALIDFFGSKLTIKHQCELLGLPRSTAYHVPVVPIATKVEIDISYIGTPTGFVYITAIIDWYSRFIVGYTISNSLQTDSVTRVVKDAIRRHGKLEIINSDQGRNSHQKSI